MSLQQWDLERARLERLAGSNSIVKFTRRQQLKERKPDSQPEVKRVRVIEPELIQQAQVVQPVEPEVLSPVASSIAVPATLPQGNTADDWKTVVALSAAIAMICSVDRAAMSVALGPMGDIFSWTDTTKGAISSSFFLGYTLTNLIGGYAATRYNPKTVLTAGAVLWSVFTLATPSMAGNLPALMATRAVMGMGEGVAMPAISNLFARWVPQANLSSSLSLAFTGGPVGIITALVVAPPLISNLGWESVFWMCGASGLAWAAWWHPSVAEEPPSLVAAYAEADVAEVAAPKPESQLKISDVPWGRFATNVPVLALLGVHCSANAGPLIILSWLPMYLATQFGLDAGSSAALSILPWAVNIACTNVGGWLGDKAIQEWGVDKTVVRKTMQGVASLGPAACLFVLAADQGEGHSLQSSVVLVSAALGLGGFQAAGLGSNHQDLAPRWAGILYGCTNACASVFGVAGIMGTGYLLDATHSWSQVYGLAAAVYAIGYGGFFAFGSAEKQFE